MRRFDLREPTNPVITANQSDSDKGALQPAAKYPSFPLGPISLRLAGALFLISAAAAVIVTLITLQNLTGEGMAKLKNLQTMLFTVKGLVFRPLYWIAEEIIFRGFLLQVLRRKFSLSFAMFVSGFLFAATHFGKGLPDTMLAFGFSYYFAWLMVRTNSLYAPIVAHGSFDVVAFYGVTPIVVACGQLVDGRYSFPLWGYGVAPLLLVLGVLTLLRSLKASSKAVPVEAHE